MSGESPRYPADCLIILNTYISKVVSSLTNQFFLQLVVMIWYNLVSRLFRRPPWYPATPFKKDWLAFPKLPCRKHSFNIQDVVVSRAKAGTDTNSYLIFNNGGGRWIVRRWVMGYGLWLGWLVVWSLTDVAFSGRSPVPQRRYFRVLKSYGYELCMCF